MAIVSMQKIRFFIHRSETKDILNTVQKEGVLEFTDVTEENKQIIQREKKAFEFNYVSSRLDFTVHFLSKYAPSKGKLATMIEGDKEHTTEKELEKVANSFYYNEIIDEVQSLEEKINDTKAKNITLDEEMVLLLPWENLEMTLDTEMSTKTSSTLYIHGKKEKIQKLHKAFEETALLYELNEVTPENQLLTHFTEKSEEIETVLRENDIEMVTLPKRRGTPKEEIERIDRSKIKQVSQLEGYEKRIIELTEHLPKLKIVADYIFWKKQKHDVISSSMNTNNILIFEGWCPTLKVDSLRKIISEKSDLFALEEISAQPDEDPPVEIKNNALIKPFEAVTRLYGLPGHTDLDPTIYLSGFFFIFFGLSLTDFGYGVFLAVLIGLILKFYKVPKELKPMLGLIGLGGVASIFVGLLFGGYFGISMDLMPTWVQAMQKFDPISNPIPVFYLALAFGVFQIFTGLILKVVSEAKNGRFNDGILDNGPWIALFMALAMLGGNATGYLSGDSKYYVWMIYAVVASLVLTQGRKEKNIIMKFLKGVLSLYGVVNFFSDILSYSRLLALGLATSALAFAINLIAEMVSGIPYIGWILMVLVLIAGHIFNVVVNVLGAFIHSARLQFVEFFGKFITSNGRLFKPFKRDQRNVILD